MTLRWNEADSFSRNVKKWSSNIFQEKKVYNLQQTNRQKMTKGIDLNLLDPLAQMS